MVRLQFKAWIKVYTSRKNASKCGHFTLDQVAKWRRGQRVNPESETDSGTGNQVFTQDGYHHVSSQYLYGPPRYKVEGSEDVPGVDQRVTRGCVGGFELHGQRPEAALGGAFKSLAVLQQCPVQMEADICLETLWETFQYLGRGRNEEAKKTRKDNEKENRDGTEGEERT